MHIFVSFLDSLLFQKLYQDESDKVFPLENKMIITNKNFENYLVMSCVRLVYH